MKWQKQKKNNKNAYNTPSSVVIAREKIIVN